MAARMGTTQSVVARIESGRGMPSLRTVQRFASAVGARAVVRIVPLKVAQAGKDQGPQTSSLQASSPAPA